jgi:uncharacterized SAM-dependent methyltransferase
MSADDRMLLGLDATQDKEVIWNSYHDSEGIFHRFIRNGFRHSNKVLGHDWYRYRDWTLSGEFQENPLMHHFTMTAVRDIEVKSLGITFRKGEKVICYEGFKYNPRWMQRQFAAAGLTKLNQWKSPSGRICMCRNSSFQLTENLLTSNSIKISTF